MKRTKKALSLLLTLAMVVAMMPAISLVFPEKAKAYSTFSKPYSTEYYYASGTKFISALCVGWDGSSLSTIGSQMTNAGWTKCANFIDMMSWDGKGDIIAVGYKTTTDPTQALTDVEFWDSDDGHSNYSYHGKNVNWPGGNTAVENINGTNYTGVKDKNTGIIFHRVGGAPMTAYSKDGIVDWFKDFGSGYGYQYLCATKNRSAGAAITAVDCRTGSGSGWTLATCLARGCTAHCSAHGHSSRYMGYKRLTTTVDSSTLRTNYTNALNTYNSITRSNYTTASYTALENALTTASSILTDLNDGYTTSSQTAINNAATALSNARSGLQTNLYLKASTNGGASDQTVAVTVGTGTTGSVDLGSYSAAKSGWSFLGWNASSTAADGSKSAVSVGFNNTYYAIFSKTLTGTFHYLNASAGRTNSASTVTIYNTATSGSVASLAG